MNTPANMTERHGRMLVELADLGMALARDLHGRALAAEDEAACDLSLAFQRVSRSLRQTLALEARLERERRQGVRDAADLAARETLERVQQRRRQVRTALAPLIWDEAEGEEAEALFEDLEARLMAGGEDDGFADLPLDACIARIRADLGLAPADTADNDTTPAAPSVVIWRSSA